jgi:acetyl esterase/lipase
LNLNYRPQNILLSGDSAGANLVLSLLSHLSHPHPSTTLRIPAITLSAPLRGAVLISPWVSFNTQTPSFLSNAYKDSLTPTALHSFSRSFLSHQPPDYYNEPLSAPESWWSDIPIDELLIVAGEDEVLIDSIRAMDEKLRLALGDQRVKRLVARGEYHDQSSLDLGFGYREMDEGVQAKKIKSWIGSKL